MTHALVHITCKNAMGTQQNTVTDNKHIKTLTWTQIVFVVLKLWTATKAKLLKMTKKRFICVIPFFIITLSQYMHSSCLHEIV